jgi:hypothetical protein
VPAFLVPPMRRGLGGWQSGRVVLGADCLDSQLGALRYFSRNKKAKSLEVVEELLPTLQGRATSSAGFRHQMVLSNGGRATLATTSGSEAMRIERW